MIIDLDQKVYLLDNNSNLVEIAYISLKDRKVSAEDGKAYDLDKYRVVNVVPNED